MEHIIHDIGMYISGKLADDTHKYARDNDIPYPKMMATGYVVIEAKLIPSVVKYMKQSLPVNTIREKVYTELYTEIISKYQ